MATFELEFNGKTYEIDAPDQASAFKAFQGFANPQQPAGPVQAAQDIGRMMVKGAAMGKEATPEDAADRANALRQSMGRRMGRTIDAPAAMPADYQPFFADQKKEQMAAAARAGYAGTAGEILGGLAVGGPIQKGIGTLAEAAKAAPVAGKLLSSPFTQAAGAGAIYGVSQAQGTDTDKLKAAGVGVAAGLGGQAIGSALAGTVNKVAGAFNKAPTIPTAAEIELAKRNAYDAADKAGVVYTPELFKRIQQNATEELTNLGYSPKLQPKIAAVLEEIGKAGEGNVTMKGAEVVRKIAGNAYDPGNKSNNQMMGLLKQKIDEAMGAPKPNEVLMGDAQAGMKALQEGRRNAQIGFKLEDVAKAQEIAKLQTAAAGSGGNIDNNTRRKIAQALLMPGKGGGLTADEIAAAERVVYGTTGQNAARLAGKLSPEGNGLMTVLHALGGASTGGMTLPLAAVGFGAKRAADKATEKNLEQLIKVISAGGSKSATEASPNAVQRLTKSERDALVRALTIGAIPSALAVAQ
jgi:hypothetical protein